MENDKKYFGYIYKFIDDTTRKIYVGKREKSTFDESYYGSGKKWNTEVLKNEKVGKEHVIREVLEWCGSREELESREKFWIAKLDARNPEVGYNIHKGGKGGNSLGDTEAWSKLHRGERNGRFGKEVSQETRGKISAARSGTVMKQETKDKISTTLTGKPKPEGFGEKISNARTGTHCSEKTKEKLRLANTGENNPGWGKIIYNDGEHEKRFYPNEEIPAGFVEGRVIKGRKIVKSNPTECHWYTNDIEEVYTKDSCPEGWHSGRVKGKLHFDHSYIKGAKNGRARVVRCIDTGEIFDCIKDAEKAYNCSHISDCCNGIREFSCRSKYRWEWYIDEDK